MLEPYITHIYYRIYRIWRWSDIYRIYVTPVGAPLYDYLQIVF